MNEGQGFCDDSTKAIVLRGEGKGQKWRDVIYRRPLDGSPKMTSHKYIKIVEPFSLDIAGLCI